MVVVGGLNDGLSTLKLGGQLTGLFTVSACCVLGSVINLRCLMFASSIALFVTERSFGRIYPLPLVDNAAIVG